MNLFKVNRKTALLFLATMAFGVSSCSKDDNDDQNSGGEDAKTAWVIGYGVQTQQGRIYYMEARENLPSNTNPGEAVELGLNSRIYSYGENPYTWNGDASTMTKWEVDKSTLALKPSGIISFASTGVTGNIAGPAFISETQAFSTNLAEGVVIEWNPSTMEITKKHQVDPFPNVGVDGLLFEFNKEVTADGKILIPIETNPVYTCCEYPKAGAGARTAIFDPVAGKVTYHVDNRLLGSSNAHYTDPVTGSRYATPAWGNSFVPVYFNNAASLPKPRTLLKVNDDGTFDPNYEYNLDDVLGMAFYYSTSFIYDNKIVFTYVSDDYKWGSFAEAAYIFGADFKTAQIDLETNEVKPFDGLSGYSYNSLGEGRTIDGKTYVGISDNRTDTDRSSTILQQNAIDDYTVITKHSGGNIEHYNKLW